MKMLPLLIFKSLRQRPGRALLIVLTLVMGLSLEAALLSLAMDIGNKSEQELKAFGSNILLLPRESEEPDGVNTAAAPSAATSSRAIQGHIPEAQLASLGGAGEYTLDGYAPFLYEMVQINGNKVIVSGTVFDQALKINPWWKITGDIPPKNGKNVLIGAELAKKLNLGAGDSLSLSYGDRRENMIVSGTVLTGGSEDNQILMNLELAQSLSNLPGKVSVVQVSVTANENQSLDGFASSLENRVPAAHAKTIKQVADAGQNLLGKINMLMGLVTVLIIFIAGLTVSASLANAVIERRREIGLMKSLGAEGRGIAVIILGESLALSAVAGPLGCLMGLAMAQAIGLSVFDTTVSLHLPVIPVVIISAALLAFVASLMPVHRALSIEPAVILRGE